MTPRRCRTFGAALLAIATAAAGLAQSVPQQPIPQQPTFRAGVDLVQIDVVVLDAQGEAVRGLTRDDFVLLDRGVVTPVATLAEQHHDGADVAWIDRPVADVADNQATAANRVVMIVLDDLHVRARTEEVRALLRQVVNGLGDEASIGLVTTSGTAGIEITDDRMRVLQVVDRFLDRFDPHRAVLPPTIRPSVTGRGMAVSGDLASGFATLHAYKTTQDVARMMGANDGRRKAVIWITAGLAGGLSYARACAGDGGDAGVAKYLCGMYDMLRRSGVTVYGVNPGGPEDRGDVLRNVAAETGGFSVASRDLDRGMRRLMTDIDHYYLLGFYPADTTSGPFREVEVRVNRPGLTVRHRRGYDPDGPPDPPRNRDPLDRLVATVMPASGLALRLAAAPVFSGGSKPHVLATMEVALPGFPAIDDRGLSRDLIQYGLYAVDLRRKRVVTAIGRKVEIDWPLDAAGAPTGSPRFRLENVLTLSPGAYQVRFSATSKAFGTEGSAYLMVDVPSPKDDAVPIAGPVLGREGEAATLVVDSRRPAGLGLPFAPVTDRVFSANDVLRVFFQVGRRRGISGSLQLVDRSGATASALAWSASPESGGNLTLRMPLAGLPPGSYRLVVTASRDGGPASRREIALLLTPPTQVKP